MAPADNPSDSMNHDDLQELPARRGFSVFYRGKTLLSRIDPVAQGERLAAEIPVKERTLYFCPSPIYGYGLSLFLAKLGNELQKKNSVILCVEADEKLFEISRNALGKSGAGVLDERTGSLFYPAKEGNLRPLALTRVSDPETLCAFVRETWGERVFRRVEVIRLTGGWQLFPGLYENLAEALRREMAREWGNAMTLIRLGRLYTRNLIRNLAFLPESENIGALNFGSSPVLVLGAGPSLDPLLDELSALAGGSIPGPGQRPFKIICVDTCLPALHDRLIVPDLVVILESQHWNLRDFSGALDRKIDAAVDLSALPASARVLGGERFFFATPWTELRLFRRLEEAGLLPETFDPLGSVGLSAVALALYVGSGPVFTGGIDFAYTLDAYHARSTAGYGDLERRQNRFRSIIGPAAFGERTFIAHSKTGTPVRSDPVMRNYRNLFEQEFAGNHRLSDINGPGLPLGVKTVSPLEAFSVLNGEVAQPPHRPAVHDLSLSGRRDKITAFVRREIDSLETIRDVLTGANPLEPDRPAERQAERLEELLDASDYLWAHFPDCAGAGGRRPQGTDLGFLKRVRAEIDPFMKLWEMTLTELLKN